MISLSGKNVVITGAAQGIGLATTKRLLQQGCKVSVWDYNTKALEAAQQSLAPFGTIFTHQCDVTDKKRVYELAALVKKEMGPVDILINNAGVVFGGHLLDRTDEEWEKTIDVNLTSLVYTTRAFLPDMYERNSGHIINLSSASSTIGVPGLAVYTATKWAVWGLTESLRFEALSKGKDKVFYSSIHPSYIAHGLFEGAKLGFLGNLIVPLVKDHDIIAKAIVEAALKGRSLSPKRPRTVNLTVRLRGLLPDRVFQKMLVLLGVPQSMERWSGRK